MAYILQNRRAEGHTARPKMKKGVEGVIVVRTSIRVTGRDGGGGVASPSVLGIRVVHPLLETFKMLVLHRLYIR